MPEINQQSRYWGDTAGPKPAGKERRLFRGEVKADLLRGNGGIFPGDGERERPAKKKLLLIPLPRFGSDSILNDNRSMSTGRETGRREGTRKSENPAQLMRST